MNTYRVNYTKKIGGNGQIFVKAESEKEAIANAKQHCHTGSNFRDAIIVDDSLYDKPKNQGFQGSQRIKTS